MHKLFLAMPLVAVAGCAGLQQAANDLGVSPAVQEACMQAVAQEIPGIDENMDFDAMMDRLKDNGKACLIASIRDFLTARIVAAQPTNAGEVVPADPVAAAAIAG